MDLFKFKKRQPLPDHGLHGEWLLIRSEQPIEGEARMVFSPDGTLQYCVRLPKDIQKVNLTYRISGDMIISDQPSHPREERSRFSFEEGGSVLVLETEGIKSWFRKQG